MSKHKYRYSRPTQKEILLGALQRRAETLTTEKQHFLGLWEAAKKKHGIGAMKCLCLNCGLQVIISPQLPGALPQRRTAPGMKGEALFETCKTPTLIVDGELAQ